MSQLGAVFWKSSAEGIQGQVCRTSLTTSTIGTWTGTNLFARDPQQIEWLQAFYQIFRDLSEYVKQHHSNGIVWNANGESAANVAKTISTKTQSASATPKAGPAIAGGAPPPPPPPPGPPPVLDIKTETKKASSEGSGGLRAVFSQLNKGEAVTKGLRKVDRSEMTHKNPNLRTNTTVSDTASRAKSPAPGKKPKPESMRMKKPPKKELDGNKWIVVC